jgi:hypothetical protein
MTYRIGAAFGLILVVSTHTWAAEPVDASTYKVHCNTVIGTISFKPGLKTGGSETSVSGKVKATLDGCAATLSNGDPAAVTIQSGAVSGKLTGTSNDCTTLLNGGPLTDSLKIKWETTPKLLENSSFLTLSALSFNTFSPVFAPFPFSGTYGAFQLTVSGVTGSFHGLDGGAGSFTEGTTGQDVFTLLDACGGNGLKVINFGFGDVTLQ